MSQTPIPFSSSFCSLTLNVTTGTPPNQVTHTQAITSVYEGNNSVPITDAGILNAFNSQAAGTSFTPSIVATYGSDGNGNALKTVSTPSLASFIPRPPPPISLASNNVTIQYTGVAGDVPNNMPRFIEANLRGTGNEWFAVVNDSSKTQITSYARNEQSGISYFTTSGQLVPFNNIVTSLMTDMNFMFDYAAAFNSDISEWDTSSVMNMNSMFNEASSFNQSLYYWNTSNVTDMGSVFQYAAAFNGNVSSWNTSKVTNMVGMFASAYEFNQPLNSWNTSKVTNMAYMFIGSSAFNRPLNLWDTSAVTNMSFMFAGAGAFNQNISEWDVALTLARPSLTRNNFADNSPLALPENSHKLPPFV